MLASIHLSQAVWRDSCNDSHMPVYASDGGSVVPKRLSGKRNVMWGHVKLAAMDKAIAHKQYCSRGTPRTDHLRGWHSVIRHATLGQGGQ
jgi:hypothetical protein